MCLVLNITLHDGGENAELSLSVLTHEICGGVDVLLHSLTFQQMGINGQLQVRVALSPLPTKEAVLWVPEPM